MLTVLLMTVHMTFASNDLTQSATTSRVAFRIHRICAKLDTESWGSWV